MLKGGWRNLTDDTDHIRLINIMGTILIEREFTGPELLVCTRLFEQIVKQHNDCDGKGIVLKGDQFDDCDCRRIYDFVKTLVWSRVPRLHWQTKPDENVYSILFDGQPLCVTGDSLQGKTRILSGIAIRAITKGSTVCYATANEIVTWKSIDDRDFEVWMDRILGSEVVLIDDLDRLEKNTSWSYDIIDLVLKKIIDSGKALMVSVTDADQVRSDRIKNLIENCRIIACGNPVKNGKVLDFFGQDFRREALRYTA